MSTCIASVYTLDLCLSWSHLCLPNKAGVLGTVDHTHNPSTEAGEDHGIDGLSPGLLVTRYVFIARQICPGFSKGGPWTSSASIARELAGNEEPQALPQTHWARTCIPIRALICMRRFEKHQNTWLVNLVLLPISHEIVQNRYWLHVSNHPRVLRMFHYYQYQLSHRFLLVLH